MHLDVFAILGGWLLVCSVLVFLKKEHTGRINETEVKYLLAYAFIVSSLKAIDNLVGIF